MSLEGSQMVDKQKPFNGTIWDVPGKDEQNGDKVAERDDSTTM